MKRVMKWMMVCLLIAAVVATFFFLWKRAQPKPVEYETLTVKRRDMKAHRSHRQSGTTR